MLNLVTATHIPKDGEIMLQDAEEDTICTLSEAKGRDVHLVDVKTLQAGAIIQVTTESGGVYLLEVISEHSGWVHFARCDKGFHNSGRYFGKQKLDSSVITVGEVLAHDKMVTQPVTKISLLCE